jgi:hypothetical protein
MINTRIALAVAMLSLSAGSLAAQQPGPPRAGAPRRGDTAMVHQQMRMMDSMTSRLDSLVSRMNKATSKTKVAAMAEVINELVAQRKAMWGRMDAMMESRHGMMGNMPGRDTTP